LGIGDWGLGPIPNPQSPIPNPQSPFNKLSKINKNNLNIFITSYKTNLANNNKKIKLNTKNNLSYLQSFYIFKKYY
jgi:hypothetical protein